MKSRQRPTLPHTYACSTIGGGRLNFRVRNGNGCDPAPMTTGKLVVFHSSNRTRSTNESQICLSGVSASAPKALRRTSRHGLSDVAREASRVGIVPNYLKEHSAVLRRSISPGSRTAFTTEYPANGSSTRPHVSRCVAGNLQVSGRKKKGQAARLISTSQLNASRRFHTWPINLVVYQEPSEVLRPGRSHLVEGFTLRCLQHFSHPDVATRRCRWRDNRYTRGPSNPVLSY